MSNIDFTSSIQAGVTAPALMDAKAAPSREAPQGIATQTRTEGEAAEVQFSEEAQMASGVNPPQETGTPGDEGESDDFGQHKANSEDFEKVRAKVEEDRKTYDRIERRAQINMKDGILHMKVEREGEVKDIPPEEVLKLRENLKQYLENRQMFKGLDFFA